MSDWGIGVGSKAERRTYNLIENGYVSSEVNSQMADSNIWEQLGEWVVGGIKALATFLIDNNEVFIIVCMVGMIIVIIGKDELGKKIASGGFIGFIISKVVAELC